MYNLFLYKHYIYELKSNPHFSFLAIELMIVWLKTAPDFGFRYRKKWVSIFIDIFTIIRGSIKTWKNVFRMSLNNCG